MVKKCYDHHVNVCNNVVVFLCKYSKEIGLDITPKVAVKYPLGNQEVEGSNPSAAT